MSGAMNHIANSFSPDGEFVPAALFLPQLRERFAAKREREEAIVELERTRQQLDTVDAISDFGRQGAAATDPVQQEGARRSMREMADAANMSEFGTRSLIQSAGLRKDQIRKNAERQQGATEAAQESGVDPRLLGGITDQGQRGQVFGNVASSNVAAKRQQESATFENRLITGRQRSQAALDHSYRTTELMQKARVDQWGRIDQYNRDIDEIRVRAGTERQTALLKPTDTERDVAAYSRSLQSGSRVAITATRNKLLEEKGEGFVVMTDPASGQLVAGSGKAAHAAITTASRTRLEGKRENAKKFLNLSTRLIEVAGPDTLGIRGYLKGSLQNFRVSSASAGEIADATAELALNLEQYAGDSGALALLQRVRFDPNIPATEALAIANAAAQAHANNPDGRISDPDMRLAMQQVGTDQWLANPLDLRVRLEALRKSARDDLRQSTRALRASGQRAPNPMVEALRAEELRTGNLDSGLVDVANLTPEELERLSPDQREAVRAELARRVGAE